MSRLETTLYRPPVIETDRAAPWYVVHTRPRKELMVASLLDADGAHEVFLPEVLRQQRDGKRRQPLFPGYLFIRPDLGIPAMTPINSTPGVVRLIAFDHRPQPVPAADVDRLRTKIKAVNDQGGLPPHNFKTGDSVRLTGGALNGFDAVFQGPMHPAQRVTVLLAFLGQLQAVQVDVDHVEATTRRPPRRTRRPPRRTRGRGRHIRARA